MALDSRTIYPHAAALAFDGRGRLLVGRLDDRVDVIDPASATISASIAVPRSSANVAMAVGDSGIVVASGDFGLVAFEPDGQRVRWSTDLRPVLRGSVQLACPVGADATRVLRKPVRADQASSISRTARRFPPRRSGPSTGSVGTIDVSADGAVLTAISGSQPIISRWHLEGFGLGRRLVARGHMLAGPYSFEGSSVVTAPQTDRSRRRRSDGSSTVSSRVSSSWTRRPASVTYRYEEPVSDVGWVRDRGLYARSDEDNCSASSTRTPGKRSGTPIWGFEALALERRREAPRDTGRRSDPGLRSPDR